MAFQVAGIVDRVPAPAEQGAGGAGQADQHLGDIRMAQLGLAEHVHIDAGNARCHDQQWQGQLAQGHGAVILVAHQRDDDGNDTDDQGGGRHAGQLDAHGEQHVVDDVAGQCLAHEGGAVAAFKAFEQAAQARKHEAEGDGAVGGVAADGQLEGGKCGQQLRHNEHHAPHRPGQQTAQHTYPHTTFHQSKTASVSQPRRIKGNFVDKGLDSEYIIP